MKEKVLTTVVTFETASYMKEQDLEYEKIYRILA